MDDSTQRLLTVYHLLTRSPRRKGADVRIDGHWVDHRTVVEMASALRSMLFLRGLTVALIQGGK